MRTSWTTIKSDKPLSQILAEMACGLLVLGAIGYASVHASTDAYHKGFRLGVDAALSEVERQLGVGARGSD